MTVNNHLFNANDPTSIATVQAVLAKVILPWAPDNSSPPKFIRVDGLGRTVATVTSWLGGYGDAHGGTLWGYKVHWETLGNPCTSGVITRGPMPFNVAKALAMNEVDEFLEQKHTGYTVLKSTVPLFSAVPGPRTEDIVDAHPDVFCEVPKDAHKCYGTGNHHGF